MQLAFHKYQATGNDFILLNADWLPEGFVLDENWIRSVCDRHFGVGADGLILLKDKEGFDFQMDYYNSDGRPSSMCGNGGRAIVAFAYALGKIGKHCRFHAFDGPHEARIFPEERVVELQMQPVRDIRREVGYFFLDTGSPHHVQFVESLDTVNVFREGRAIRSGPLYGAEGANVNFVEAHPDGIRILTYERGVENETLSCGTGVTASALAYALSGMEEGTGEVSVETRGGKLQVRFRKETKGFSDIWLCGPARKVFEGNLPITLEYGTN